MTTSIFPNIDQALSHALDRVMTCGQESAPRGKRVRELVGEAISFDMRYPIVTKPSRKIGYRFYPAEAAWILSGDNRLETIKRYSPFIWEFSDDGFFYQGAYGPRVVDQLTYVCDVLADDPDTRQAVIEVWRPNPRPGRDIPCTLSYQFLARDGMLHCVQSMRSSDVWLGYPYDAFNAAMLTTYIILLLRERKKRGRKGLKLGHHTLVVGSQHIYEPQWQSALDFVYDADTVAYEPTLPEDFDKPQSFIDYLWFMASRTEGVNPRKKSVGVSEPRNL
jgi:thymidylate synthase